MTEKDLLAKTINEMITRIETANHAYSADKTYNGNQKCELKSLHEGSSVLPSDFSPGEYDVICARGNIAKSHSGNVFYQSIIEDTAPRYGSSEGKLSKSIIVSAIIDTIRRLSPRGGFVKPAGGKWIEIGNQNAREKVSQALRDQLHSQYRSSASSKRRKKDEVNAKMLDNLDLFVKSNQFVLNRMALLASTIENHNHELSDEQLGQLMSQVNCEILHELKRKAWGSVSF